MLLLLLPGPSNTASPATHPLLLLPKAFFSVLVVYFALLGIYQGFVGMVDFCKVLCCLCLLLLRTSDLVCKHTRQLFRIL